MDASWGELIKNLRAILHKTQDDLSVLVGVDRSTISKWESDALIPDEEQAKKAATAMGLAEEEAVQAVTESSRRRNSRGSVVAGNYELYQWSYIYDEHIMKTNITVRSERNHLVFEEFVETAVQKATIKGTVSIEKPNLFFYGKSQDPVFNECEVIIVTVPRVMGQWLTGVVAGVSSDAINFPSASRAVIHYIGDDQFGQKPNYFPIDALDIPPEYKKYLSLPVKGNCPVISAREHNLLQSRPPNRVKPRSRP